MDDRTKGALLACIASIDEMRCRLDPKTSLDELYRVQIAAQSAIHRARQAMAPPDDVPALSMWPFANTKD